jgi:hypothetical protein
VLSVGQPEAGARSDKQQAEKMTAVEADYQIPLTDGKSIGL